MTINDWATDTKDPLDLPRRVATNVDRWIVRYNPLTKAWYAQPRAVGVYATQYAPMVFFATLVAAGDYARGRTKAVRR
jgi:hypothetical protein